MKNERMMIGCTVDNDESQLIIHKRLSIINVGSTRRFHYDSTSGIFINVFYSVCILNLPLRVGQSGTVLYIDRSATNQDASNYLLTVSMTCTTIQPYTPVFNQVRSTTTHYLQYLQRFGGIVIYK